ncbi:MAG: ParB/RepB/Spo0J family partition protein [Planctomycetaceae bacterium]|nr:ParB/RepB/Spo0J family partition protein [Planctomycetales bacterium]MCB9927186.1 ParB/RepB/Spo0J family partition protein [Planctomycetaceae bacterium]
MIATTGTNIETIRVKLDDIGAAAGQPRKDFDEAKLRRLAQSMSEFDLLQPIGVRASTGSKHWELCFGERRLRAARLLGWRTIEARVLDLNDVGALKVVGIENLNRADWNLIEKAEYLETCGRAGMTNKQIGQTFGHKDTWSTNLRRLLKLPEHIKQRVIAGEISETKARYLLRFLDRAHVIAAIEDDLDSNPDLWRTRDEFQERAEYVAACFDDLDSAPSIESKGLDGPRAAAGDRQSRTDAAPDWTRFKPYLPIIEPLRNDRDALLLLRELVDVLLAELKKQTSKQVDSLEPSV